MLRLAGLKAQSGMIILLATVLVGAALRMVGLQWGLPASLHPDEWVIVTGALDLAARNSFEPSLYFRPDHVEIQLSYLAYTAYSHLVVHAPTDVAYAANPAAFTLISRFITSLFGTAMIVLAYVIGKRFNATVAVIASVIVALFPLFVENSHYATPDIPLTAAVMVVTLACIRYLESPRLPSLLVASAATSVAIAIKYPGAVAAVMIAVVVVVAAVLDRQFLRILRHGAIALVAVVVVLFLISPVLFTNISGVIAAIRQESRTTHAGADGSGWAGNLYFYGATYATEAGVLLVLAVAVGLWFVIRSKLVAAIPLAIGAIFWIVLSVVPLHWDRWALPMFITPIFLGAIGLDAVFRYSRARAGEARWPRIAAAAVGIVVVAGLGAGAVASTALLVAPDTRNSSRAEVHALGATADNTIFEGYSPLLPSATTTIFDRFERVDGRLAPIDTSKQFVLTSSCVHARYFDDAKYEKEREFYADLDANYDVELNITAVPEWAPVGIEAVNVASAISTVGAYIGGGSAGCDIRVYRLPTETGD